MAMITPDLKDAIDNVIDRSFNAITNLYNKKNDYTRLVFPKYTHGSQKGKPRVSEQEFRQLFIEELNRYADKKHIEGLHYSVETPTKEKYRFPEKGEPRVDDNGVSGRFDLTIEMNGKMVAIIEFKAGNAFLYDYKKDLCKLANPDEGEKDTLRYFVNILEDSYQTTINSIDNKLKACKKGKETIHYWFLSMGVHRQRNRISKEFIY